MRKRQVRSLQSELTGHLIDIGHEEQVIIGASQDIKNLQSQYYDHVSFTEETKTHNNSKLRLHAEHLPLTPHSWLSVMWAEPNRPSRFYRFLPGHSFDSMISFLSTRPLITTDYV